MNRIFISLAIISLLYCSQVWGSDKKGCQLNEVLIHEEIFPNFACWKCYEKFKTYGRLLAKVNCRVKLDEENYSVPGFVVDSDCVAFDHRTKSISALVQSSMTNSTFIKWQRCCNEAIDCCESMVQDYQVENFFNTCDNHWDGTNCYRDSFPNEKAMKLCPHDMTKHENSRCPHFYSKFCNHNGSWSLPDYSECFESKRLQANIIVELVVISLSLVISVPAALTVIINKTNLTKASTAIVVLLAVVSSRNIFIVIAKLIILIDATILGRNLWFCKVTTVSAQFLETSAILSLAVIAVLLQSSNEKSLSTKLLFSSFVIASITTSAWSVLMHFTLNQNCWLSESDHPQNLVNNSLRLAAVVVAIVLLIRAIRKVNGSSTFPAKILLCESFLFLLPLSFQLWSASIGCCGNESAFNIILIICFALQAILLIPAIFVDKNLLKSLKSPEPSDSNASLANSQLTSDMEERKQQQIKSWHEFVLQARNSFCNENFYTVEPSPPVVPLAANHTRQRAKSELILPSRQPRMFRHRNKIREVMRRAKVDFPKPLSPPILMNPPLPKNIPNQVLDDVQLFEFYYKNLNSVYFTESSQGKVNGGAQSDETTKRIEKHLS